MTKRLPGAGGSTSKGKPAGGGGGNSGGGGGSTGGTTPTVPAAPNVIFLDFNGQYVTGTMWNTNGAINAAAANLTAEEIDAIFQRVYADFAPFNVTVTLDETVYNVGIGNKFFVSKRICLKSWLLTVNSGIFQTLFVDINEKQ